MTPREISNNVAIMAMQPTQPDGWYIIALNGHVCVERKRAGRWVLPLGSLYAVLDGPYDTQEEAQRNKVDP